MKIKTWLIAVPFVFSMVGVANAEPSGWEGRQAHKIERMTTDLGLSTEQAAKMKAVFEAQTKQHQAQRAETEKQIKSILTKEQLAKHEARMAEREKMRAEKPYGKKGHKGCDKAHKEPKA
ncbi:MAG: hypothetical protein Q8J65_00910 [Nitrosomonadales bacterium]|nr:hypothetical protein [Nitrosomonadales bacterium]